MEEEEEAEAAEERDTESKTRTHTKMWGTRTPHKDVGNIFQYF